MCGVGSHIDYTSKCVCVCINYIADSIRNTAGIDDACPPVWGSNMEWGVEEAAAAAWLLDSNQICPVVIYHKS
jgi:hypothetical protein